MNSPLALAIILFLIILLATFLIFNIVSSGRFSKLKKSNIEQLTNIQSYDSSSDGIVKSSSDELHPFESYLYQFKIFSNLKIHIIRANIDKTLMEIMSLCLLMALLSFVLFFVLLHSPIGASIILTLLLGGVPIYYVLYKEADIRVKFEKQLPETLDFLSRAMRAGHGVAAAIKMVSEEMPDPIGREFSMVSDELNFGIPFSQALNNMGLRVNSKDLHFFLVALAIQRETGGNLTEILTVISKTMRERIKLNGKIRTLAAEGKMSGMILGSMPFFMALILNTLNPGYFDPVMEGGGGIIGIAVMLLAFGGLWIMKIVKIKV
jgi:tight adherence protein B